MTLVSGSIPHLVGGVSQQPAAARFVTQAEEMQHMLPSLVEGLRRRPPAVHHSRLLDFLALTPDADLTAPFAHWFERNDQRMLLLVEGSRVLLYDVDARVYRNVTVSAAALSYLNAPGTQSRVDLGALTVADTTFIWNRKVAVANVATASPARTNQSLLFVRASAYQRRFELRVSVNGGAEQTIFFQTPDGSTSGDEADLDLSRIARVLAGTDEPFNPESEAPRSTLRLNDIPEFTIEVIKSTIVVTSTQPFRIIADDGQGGEGITVVTDRTQRFSDLPRAAVDGFLTEVSQDPASGLDNYWVRYADTAGDAEGVWQETIGPGVNLGVDPATMPLVLRPTTGDDWELVVGSWEPRQVGTVETSPDPEFIGQRVNGLVFFRNRLGIMAGETISFSSTDTAFNFYKSSVATTIDTDPFSLTNPASKTAVLRHGVPFNERLVLFADDLQLQVTGGDSFTRETAVIVTTTEFEADPFVVPQSTGASLAFLARRGQYAVLREYFVDNVTATNASSDVSAQVPKYVPEDVHTLAVSPLEQAAALVPASENTVYLWRWFNSGNERPLSSWSRWPFERQVLSAYWSNSELFLLTKAPGDGVFIETIDTAPGLRDNDTTDWIAHLDHRVESEDLIDFGYNAISNVHAFRLPYAISQTDDKIVAVIRNPSGSVDWVPGTIVGQTAFATGDQRVIHFPQDLTGVSFYVGRIYRSSITLSTLYPRDGGHASNGPAILSGKTIIRNVAVQLAETGHIEANVTPTGGQTWNYKFTARLSDSPVNLFDTVPLEDATFRFPVMAQNDRVRIELFNESFLPCTLLNAEWTGTYVNFTRRV